MTDIESNVNGSEASRRISAAMAEAFSIPDKRSSNLRPFVRELLRNEPDVREKLIQSRVDMGDDGKRFNADVETLIIIWEAAPELRNTDHTKVRTVTLDVLNEGLAKVLDGEKALKGGRPTEATKTYRATMLRQFEEG